MIHDRYINRTYWELKEIGTAVPCDWDTNLNNNKKYNLTVRLMDGQNRVAQDEVWVNVANTPLLTRSILQVQQAINTTEFIHARGNVHQNFSTPIWMNVSEGSQLFVQFSGDHWLNTSRADNCLYMEMFVNGTSLNMYLIRFQRLPTGGDLDTMTVTGSMEALSAPLPAGNYTIYLTAMHDYSGTATGAKTTRSTLTVWEIAPEGS